MSLTLFFFFIFMSDVMQGILTRHTVDSAQLSFQQMEGTCMLVTVEVPKLTTFNILFSVIVVCYWTRHFTLALPLSTHVIWVQANC